MPVGRLNNTPTQNQYVESLTVRFPYPRDGFSVQVNTAAAYYQVAVGRFNFRDLEFEPTEHHTVPALLSFRSPEAEGFSPDAKYTGIRVRSATADIPAYVTVHA